MITIAANGYRFFLDDFGTGLSNFNCLLQLPFESIKLDMALTSTIDTNPDCGMVKMLIDLFHRMDLTVIAEGVETDNQVNALMELCVDKIQGYYYAAPMPISKLKEFYKNQQ
jgi:EAL domain-containing protein (putative c-di-GMP-specific phosphodiesterase class I)